MHTVALELKAWFWESQLDLMMVARHIGVLNHSITHCTMMEWKHGCSPAGARRVSCTHVSRSRVVETNSHVLLLVKGGE